MKDEKIEIRKKKVNIQTDYGTLTIIMAITILVLMAGGLSFGEWYSNWRKTHEWQFPLNWVGFTREIEVVEVQEVQQEEVIEEAEPEKQSFIWGGKASWYGARPEWCLGCNDNFIMANGERLDDTRPTIAFNKLPLGTWVMVTNVANGSRQQVQITDTGGFENHGKIADLSYALKEALNCGDVCEVVIEKY